MTVFVSLFTAFVVIIITVKKEALVLNVWCYCVSKKTCVCARFVNGPTGEETGRNGWLSAFHQQVRIVLSRVVAAVFPRTIFFFFLPHYVREKRVERHFLCFYPIFQHRGEEHVYKRVNVIQKQKGKEIQITFWLFICYHAG